MGIEIQTFFHDDTKTVCHVVSDSYSKKVAIIDSCLDYDKSSGHTDTKHADSIIKYITENDLFLEWILETHIHADHLSAAPYLQNLLGGKIGIGNRITEVQKTFGDIYNTEPKFRRDGSQFDHLFDDNEVFFLGETKCCYISTPGHTPACGSYQINDNIFVGDTLFMPDYGTARCDFPGGDAQTLYRSIKKILSFPVETNLWLCHDYLTSNRNTHEWRTTVKEQRERNPYINDMISEKEFIKKREERDAELDTPELLIPSIQVNMRAGNMPEAEKNGVSYLKVPINTLGKNKKIKSFKSIK